MKNMLWLCFLVIIFGEIAAQPKKIYFDPSYAVAAPQSKIFDEVTYIPLETNRESLFGRINQLIVTKKYFIIWDTDTDAIYFFDKEGKFIKKLVDKRYTIKSFQIDRNKNALFVTELSKTYNPSKKEIQDALDSPFKSITLKYIKAFYYDLNDIEAQKSTPVSHLDFVMANPVIFNKKYWAYSYIYANKNWEDIVDYELKLSDGKSLIHSYFPYSRQKSSIYYGSPERISLFNTFNESSLLFTRPFNYSIYKLEADTTIELYTIILPLANTLPKTFFTQSFDSRTMLENFKAKNSAYIWGLDNIIDYHNLLFFSLDYRRNFNERNFFYDKISNQFYNLNKIIADSLNAFLPVTGYRVQYFDDNYVYTSVSSMSMFQSYESSKTKNPQYPPIIKNYFNKAKQSDNPVIIQIKPGIKKN